MSLRIRKRTAKEWILLFTFVALLFQMALQHSENRIISVVFNYIDEAVAVFLLLQIIRKLMSGYKFKLFDRTIFALGILFLVIGALSSLVTRVQPFSVCMIDCFTCSKFLIGYFAMRMRWNKVNKGYIRKNLNGISRFLSVFFFVLALHDEFMSPFFPVGERRYFGVSIILMFYHPTFLAAACSILLVVLAASDKYYDNLMYMILISVVIVLTLRKKAIAFVAVFWALYFLVAVWKIRNRFVLLILGAIIALFLGYDQINTYYLTISLSPRAVMLKDAIGLANSHFPLGTGFASFGTNMAGRNYSSIYTTLGYNKMYGMGYEGSLSFLNDGLWQAILGQFGWVGTIIFLLLIVFLLKNAFLLKPKRVGFFTYNAILSANLFLIIASVGEMAYFAPYALLMFMVIGMIVNENEALIEE